MLSGSKMNIAKVKNVKHKIKVNILWTFCSLFLIYLILLFTSPFVRYYSLAYLGNSEAMCVLGIDYFKHPCEIVFSPNGYTGYYWLHRSASKGNLGAIMFLETGWSVADPKEVVYWLEKGVGFGHPWCAEQLAIGYGFGLYRLKIDPVKEAEYRAIGKRLRAEGKGSRWDQ